MKTVALIKDGIVTNVVVADGALPLGDFDSSVDVTGTHAVIGSAVPDGGFAPIPVRQKVLLKIELDKHDIAVGSSVTCIATFQDADGHTLPVTHDYSVPVLDGRGDVALIKRASFVDGVATVSMAFPASGYYSITDAAVNAKLTAADPLITLASGPVGITVYEP